jgi:GNAT superfamily N-acetyltransferase
MTASTALEVRVRAARTADSTAFARLLGQLGYPTDAATAARRLARLGEAGSYLTLVAEIDHQVVGLATAYAQPRIHHDADFARIASLIVDQAWRDRGVGKRLVEAIEKWARDQGCDVVEVTSGNQRVDAHRFYEGMGYAEKRKRFVKTI